MDRYEVLQKIGKGSFGTVSRIKRKSDGKMLVWKEMDYGKMGEKEKQQLVSEVNILREFRHDHIVRYYDRIIDRDRTKIFIVMEHCEGGDLSVLINKARRDKRYLDESVVWKVLLQVTNALADCHNKKQKIIHRDIKPGNIFLDRGGNVKLGDFGLARVLGSNSLFAHTYVGTPFYMSPEQVNEHGYNEKSDMWSLGCLIYELCALVPPFEARNQIALAVKIKAGRFSRLPRQYSEELSQIVRALIHVDQHSRPTASALLQWPSLQKKMQAATTPSPTAPTSTTAAAPTAPAAVLVAKPNDRQEYDLKQRITEVDRQKQTLEARQHELDRRERDLADRERRVTAREKEVAKKEAMLPRERTTFSRPYTGGVGGMRL